MSTLASRILIHQGDITQRHQGAIVNAANESLLGGGGVDGAIHRAAGPGLLAACREIGGCPTGEARITPAFNLHADYVIHTPGPRWRGGHRGEPALLASCYRESLRLAELHQCQTVAFPAISCGIYGYPIEAAQRIAAETILDWLMIHELPQVVTLCTFTPDLMAITRAAVDEALAHRVRLPAPRLDPEKARGVVLGAAIGDALGHPTEFFSLDQIRQRFGPQGVTGYALYWEDVETGRTYAPYTDDTQMAEAVARGLLEARAAGDHLDGAMRRIAARFIDWAEAPQGGHRAPGRACISGCRALARGVDWREAGGADAGGCGSVMRAYPFGLFFDPQEAARWAVAHSALTHRDPIALAACAAMAVGVAHALQDAPWASVFEAMIDAAEGESPPTAQMMRQALRDARAGVGPEITLDRLRGWAAHEAIAATIYIVARHEADLPGALLEAANTSGDSDSLATLAGALLGARWGAAALPAAWVADLERVEALEALARAIAGL
ncbi:O-acetyl-ADP-ribose deacetylase [Myxococcota bacterium]|nr:O-acetyl-ADP-ribose deacetylase [Myxococcota bacterium]